VISLSSAGESLNSSCLEWTTAASSSLPSWGRRLGELVGGVLGAAARISEVGHGRMAEGAMGNTPLILILMIINR
jgi:hypothetical protein